MGTRSKIVINSKKENKTVVVYKHWDGYPSDNLTMFNHAFNSVDLEGFLLACGEYYGRPSSEMVEESGTLNTGIIFHPSYQLQGDLEYFYIVDLDAKNIDIYGTGYGDEREHFQGGKISALAEVDCYRDEAKDSYRTALIKVMTNLAEQNVTINGGEAEEVIISKQLKLIKKELSEVESKLADTKLENDNNFRAARDLAKMYFNKMTAKQLKEFLEVSGLEVVKVTKRKGAGEFNLYLGKNEGFKDLNTRTPWQHVKWLETVLQLDLEVK